MKKLLIGLSIVGYLPFIDPAVKMNLTLILALPLLIICGGAVVTIATRRIEAILYGAVVSALLPGFISCINMILS